MHQAIDGVEASDTHPVIESAEGQGAQASEEHGKSAEEHGKSVESQQNGADSEGQAFGENVSGLAPDEPKDDGRTFGQTVSGEAKNLGAEPQAGPETREVNSQGGHETGETHSQGGQDIAGSHGGGKPQALR